MSCKSREIIVGNNLIWVFKKIKRVVSLERRALDSVSCTDTTNQTWRFLLLVGHGIFWVRNEGTRVGTLIVTTIYLQLIQNRYMFRSFTVLQCSHQHCVQPVVSDVEVVGYL